MLDTVSNPRVYQQAAGRVGRYKERCGRYQFASPNCLDESSETFLVVK